MDAKKRRAVATILDEAWVEIECPQPEVNCSPCGTPTPRSRTARSSSPGPKPTTASTPSSSFAGLIDGPVAHLPSGCFDANNAWADLHHNRPQPRPRRRNGGHSPPASDQPRRPGLPVTPAASPTPAPTLGSAIHQANNSEVPPAHPSLTTHPTRRPSHQPPA
jgi:hypothetical protein